MEVKGLGDKALLFENPGMQLSEIWVQQGKSYVVIRMTGASSSQLVAFARIVAGDMAARQAASTATDAIAGINAPASGVAAAHAPGGTPDAQAIAKEAQAKATGAEAPTRDAEREAGDA